CMGKAVRRDAVHGGCWRGAAADWLSSARWLARSGARLVVGWLMAFLAATPAIASAQQTPWSDPRPTGPSVEASGSAVAFGGEGAELLEEGRFRIVAYPQDRVLARSLLRLA